jgi:hypothetical protein
MTGYDFNIRVVLENIQKNSILVSLNYEDIEILYSI